MFVKWCIMSTTRNNIAHHPHFRVHKNLNLNLIEVYVPRKKRNEHVIRTQRAVN